MSKQPRCLKCGNHINNGCAVCAKCIDSADNIIIPKLLLLEMRYAIELAIMHDDGLDGGDGATLLKEIDKIIPDENPYGFNYPYPDDIRFYGWAKKQGDKAAQQRMNPTQNQTDDPLDESGLS